MTSMSSSNKNAKSPNAEAEASSPVLKTQETESQRTQPETKYISLSQDHFLEDELIFSKQLQDGIVPEFIQHSEATMDNERKRSGSNLGNVSDAGKERATEDFNDKKANLKQFQADERSVESTRTTLKEQQQSQDVATTTPVTVLPRPTRALVLPASAENSVRRFFGSSRQWQTTVSEQSENLPRAMPVVEGGDGVIAVHYDAARHELQKQIQSIRVRRISRLLYLGVFLVLATVAITLAILLQQKNSQGQEMTQLEYLIQHNPQGRLIASIMGEDAVFLQNESSPYAQALVWLLQYDEWNKKLQLNESFPFLAQRFYLATFYFSTTTTTDKWTTCNPPDQTCHLPYVPGTNISGPKYAAWLSDSHECFWAGVVCTYLHVTQLVFPSMNLVGTFPPSVAKFPFMQLLSIYSSGFGGEIPVLSDLHHLVHLHLYNNTLSGDLSSLSLWQNRKLRSFDIDMNRFTGSMPPQIRNLVDLKHLSLVVNQLTGTLPSEIGWLDSIRWFDIQSNNIRGELPRSIQLWTMIEELFIAENSFSGSIPTFLGQLNKTLKEMTIGWNNFTGTLPDELFHLSLLDTLVISNNELSGTLGARVGQLVAMEFMYLQENLLSGTIPTEMGLLAHLTKLQIHSNHFTGSVPASLCEKSKNFDFNMQADCTKDENGQAEIQCDCCQTCCKDGANCSTNRVRE